MNGQELVNLTKLRLDDLANPGNWKQETILRYLNLAERELCKRSHVLHDYTNYPVTTVQGTPTYVLDPKLLSVEIAQISTSTIPLARANNLDYYRYNTAENQPSHYDVSGFRPMTLMLVPVPDAVYTVNIGGAVYPSTDIVVSGTPEVPEEYHEFLADGAAVQALMHLESEGFDNAKYGEVRESWMVALRDAKREVYRQTFGADTIATSRSVV